MEPLFIESKIELELQSIQHEFENIVTNDFARFYRVRKLTCDPTHDFSKFEVGNLTSLAKDDKLIKLLIDFYNKYYSANLMQLAIVAKGAYTHNLFKFLYSFS